MVCSCLYNATLFISTFSFDCDEVFLSHCKSTANLCSVHVKVNILTKITTLLRLSFVSTAPIVVINILILSSCGALPGGQTTVRDTAPIISGKVPKRAWFPEDEAELAKCREKNEDGTINSIPYVRIKVEAKPKHDTDFEADHTGKPPALELMLSRQITDARRNDPTDFMAALDEEPKASDAEPRKDPTALDGVPKRKTKATTRSGVDLTRFE